ncbi:hypothetical protein [Candidatus Symbiopectobacterium sp.]|nr:hypothetical protein [Candidatus Symbiopectobacterium sp.]
MFTPERVRNTSDILAAMALRTMQNYFCEVKNKENAGEPALALRFNRAV